jgi:hypothetical protein
MEVVFATTYLGLHDDHFLTIRRPDIECLEADTTQFVWLVS